MTEGTIKVVEDVSTGELKVQLIIDEVGNFIPIVSAARSTSCRLRPRFSYRTG